MEFSTFYQELQNSTEMIRALLSGVDQEAARLKPSAESWSILEVVCHLYDEEREDFREHLDFILSTSLKTGLHRQKEDWHVIDTDGWVTERNYNEQNFADMQGKFFIERENHLHGSRNYRIQIGRKPIERSTARLVRERCSPVGSRMTISTSVNWWNSDA